MKNALRLGLCLVALIFVISPSIAQTINPINGNRVVTGTLPVDRVTGGTNGRLLVDNGTKGSWSPAPSTGQWPSWSGSAISWNNPFAIAISGIVTAVSTSNVSSLSGLPTIDGIATVDGSPVLLTAQTTGSQNGVWVTHSGAWTRPGWYPTGATIPNGYTLRLQKGGAASVYGWTEWEMTANPIVVDTGTPTWTQVQWPLNMLAQGGATSGQVLAWNGSTWAPSSAGGGFSNPMTTLGDTMYENATPAAARLAGNTTSTKKFLTQTGTGSVSAAPAWGTIAPADSGESAYEIIGNGGNYTLTQSYAAVTFSSTMQVTLPTAGQAYLVTAYLDVLESSTASDDIRALFFDSTTGLYVANCERRVSYNPANGRGLIELEKIITPANNNEVIQIYSTNATAARGTITSFRSRMAYKTIGAATSAVMSYTIPYTTGLVSHYDASTLGLSNGANVTSWSDTGSANLTLTGSGNYPTYVTNAWNGLGAVQFATTSVGLSNATSAFTGTSGWDMWVVAAIPGAVGSGKSIFTNGTDSGGSPNGFGIRPVGSSEFSGNLNGLGGAILSPVQTPLNGWAVVEYQNNMASETLWINGVSQGTGSTTPATPAGRTAIGPAAAGYLATVTVGECLLFNAALSSTNQSLILQYLQAKWGI